jgi:Uma2 family endonuclease
MAPVGFDAVESQGSRLLLDNIDWPSYRRLVKMFMGRPGLRMTYDRGTLEFMTTSAEHEWLSRIVGRFIEVLSDELAIDIAGYGSMTFMRPKTTGLEPDQCYWIKEEPRMRARKSIDLRVDPAPDLVVEIDITSSSIDRMEAYKILGVPEIWQYAAHQLNFLHLDANKAYVQATHSRAFPWLAAADLARFLAMKAQKSERALIREFRDWVRQNQPPATGQAK